ncbi:HNH endonuclease [Myroides odoratimimus]|uniref:HNH endonuclease n=1 Tax=Myroides odoratimimus TaxID=76832 RepID=UPI003F420013
MAKKVNSVKRPWVQERKPFERNIHDNSKFYNSRTWRKFRRAFLDKNPLCKMCEDNGEIVPATVADHIIPINKGGAELDEANLQGLCARCHNAKSAKDK